tara:strand:- start:472 stop:1080 length:609 start_codon:yes stop_codon:yes gene_type:complete
MKSVYDFVVSPIKSRYNNTKKIGNKELIVNTEIYNHQFVSREAVVKSVPLIGETNIKVGDTVILHHNVFRRWHNIRGEEKNSRSFFNEETYFISEEQIFLYKSGDTDWQAPKGYCFVKPIVSKNNLDTNIEEPLVGVLKYLDSTLESAGLQKEDLVGFSPDDEYEFVIDGQRLYRVMTQFITIKYEYQGDEKEYNPSWAQGS